MWGARASGGLASTQRVVRARAGIARCTRACPARVLTQRVVRARAGRSSIWTGPPPPLSSACVCVVVCAFGLEGDGIRSRHLRALLRVCKSKSLLTYTGYGRCRRPPCAVVLVARSSSQRTCRRSRQRKVIHIPEALTLSITSQERNTVRVGTYMYAMRGWPLTGQPARAPYLLAHLRFVPLGYAMRWPAAPGLPLRL